MQMLRRAQDCNVHVSAGRPTKLQRAARQLVRAKEVREFREDTGEIVVPGEVKQEQNALYADEVVQTARPKDRLSKEMRQRVRREYYGLGGAENQAMGSNYFLWIIGIVAVLAVLSKLTGAI